MPQVHTIVPPYERSIDSHFAFRLHHLLHPDPPDSHWRLNRQQLDRLVDLVGRVVGRRVRDGCHRLPLLRRLVSQLECECRGQHRRVFRLGAWRVELIEAVERRTQKRRRRWIGRPRRCRRGVRVLSVSCGMLSQVSSLPFALSTQLDVVPPFIPNAMVSSAPETRVMRFAFVKSYHAEKGVSTSVNVERQDDKVKRAAKQGNNDMCERSEKPNGTHLNPPLRPCHRPKHQ